MGRSVSVVLITFDSVRYLPRCLEGLRQQDHPELELIVIDNASQDGSLHHLLEHATPAVAIGNDTNRGYSAAANQGIARATGDFVLLLNPDVYLERGYVRALLEALERAGEQFGSATGRLLRGRGDRIEPTGELDSLGIRMTRSGRHFDIDSLADLHQPLADGSYEVFGASGAAALHRRTFLRDAAIDGEVLDEDFFAFREDADLAWRGRLLGWRALYAPEAVAYHVRRVTPAVRRSLPPFINLHGVKNRFLLRLKNEGLSLALRNAPFELFRDVVVIAATLTVERTSIPALTWLWRNRGRVLAKRRQVQRRRVVSDRELAKWFV
jgi:GT2 family glycosyltransferase